MRDFVFNITQGRAAPDGFLKPMMLVSGQLPGPLIEANAGDRIRVRVNIQLESCSTAVYWYGISIRITVRGWTACNGFSNMLFRQASISPMHSP